MIVRDWVANDDSSGLLPWRVQKRDDMWKTKAVCSLSIDQQSGLLVMALIA